MGTCPSCGAELGFGIAICPNCGSQIAGDSTTDDGHHGDIGGDPSGDGMDQGAGAASDGGSGTPGPDVPEPEELADGWVADEVTPDLPPTLDTGVPGSEIPQSHGGGFQQQGEDGTGPYDITDPSRLDRPMDEIPERPDDGIRLDDSGRGLAPRFGVGLGIAVILLIVIIALAGWYIRSGGDGDDNGEPNGNGPDPLEGLHIDKDGTTGNYPYEPPGEYHVTVALRNNGSGQVDLSDHDLSVTVWRDWAVMGKRVQALSGSIGAGGTRTFNIVVETEVLGGGDELIVGVTLRKDGGDTHVHTISFEQTM